jgi:glutamine amidotransferase
MKVGVIDYGVGNLGSIHRALGELGVTPVLVKSVADMRTTDRLILPGVGNFRDCARLLNEGNWVSELHNEVYGNRRPLLGVCVGMQLLADNSTEGSSGGELTVGLGFIPGQIRHLSSIGCSLRIPHVGWNDVSHTDDDFFDDIPNGTDFYFVHSFAFVAQENKDVVATTEYGLSITAAVRRGHVWGTQFHPEKSSYAGLQVLRNFIERS